MSELNFSPIVIGATGLVGIQLLKSLAELPYCTHIVAIVRRIPDELKNLSKVEFIVTDDFLTLQPKNIESFTHAFSCLGTTMKKAGTKEAFYRIDYEINAHFAQLFKNTNAHYILLSAIGANSKSSFFYNQVKGELEDYLTNLNLNKLSIIRPSLLLGQRPEQRLLEDASQKFYRRISRFIPNTFKYKPVTAEQVAHTMVEVARSQTVKFEIYDNLYIQKIN